MRITLFLAACLLISAPLAADMGPKPRTTAPGLQFHAGDVNGVDVEMTSEEVHLVLQKNEHGDRLDVTATFNMTNLGEDASFEVGFPIGTHKNMTGFKVATNGAEHEIKLIDRNPAKDKGDEESRMMHAHDYWYVWDASYKAGAKVTHVVTYSVDVWHFSEYRNTGYILHSGAGWKNAIGKAVVTLKFAGSLTADHVRDVGPKRNLEFKDGVFTWTFENLEPTAEDNIQISYNNRYSFAERVKTLRAEREKYFSSRSELAHLLARGHERFGRAEPNAAEVDEYVAALADLLSELKEADGKLTLPGKTTEKIGMPDDMDEDVRKMIEAMAADQPRSYCYDHGVGAFLGFMGATADVLKQNPDHKAARETLARWRKVVQAFLDGNLYADDQPIRVKHRGEHNALMKRLTPQIELADKLLAKDGG
ncbi:MAG: hypothetical protein KF696_00095 [Planctomycetes bacterium]|nr:hypothetical protein [Planctomycetota bacterium]MCW8134662.1 hypothetical protein [Planctomycetota bacterium]